MFSSGAINVEFVITAIRNTLSASSYRFCHIDRLAASQLRAALVREHRKLLFTDLFIKTF
jgi:hypothetical protein